VQSFMEESNIRWMEIIAAVCIVISSVGLVWSLRSTLKSVPYFPAALFTLFTLAFYGAGMYTLRKWNLQAISRVILLIALLLVPLSFAGAIVMSGSGTSQRHATDPVFLVALALGLCAFGLVSYSSSRELVGEASAWPLAIGVLGCSASQVLIHRADPAGFNFWRLSGLLAIPLASYLVATTAQLWRARRWPQLSRRRVNQILLVLGIATFALAAPLALILVRSSRWQTIAQASPGLSLAAAAALTLGLVIHRRTTAKDLAAYQTAGTAIVLSAGIALLMFAAFTWPEPELLLAVGLLNCLVLAALGVLAGLPLLFAPAVACGALAATIGLHLAGGHFAERDQLGRKVVQAVLMGRTSLVLGALGLALTGIAGLFHRQHRPAESLWLALSAAGLGAGAMLVALFSGFVSIPGWPQDRDLSALVLLIGAGVLLAAGPLTRWPHVAAAGSLLLWAALFQAFAFNTTFRESAFGFTLVRDKPLLLATVVHGVLAAALSAVAALGGRRAAKLDSLLSEPLAMASAVSLTAAPFIAWIGGGELNVLAALAAAAALGWLLLAISQGWPGALSACQAMLALSPALYVAGIWQARIGGASWWLAPEHLLAQLTLAGVAAILFSGIRLATRDSEAFRKLLVAPWPAVDQVLLAATTIGVPLVAMLLMIPSACWELGIDMVSPQLPRSPAGDAVGPLSRGWLALAVVLAALAASLWERVSLPALAGIGIAAYAAVWLGAAHFEQVAAVASAARWCAAIYAAVFALAFIFRAELRIGAKQLPLRWSRFGAESSHWFAAQPLVLGGLTVLLLTILAVAQNSSGVALRGPAASSIFAAIGPTASYAGPLLVIVAILLGYAVRERQAGFALGGAAVFQLAVNLAFLLHASSTQYSAVSIRNIEWIQWNAAGAGIFSLVWLGLARWITPQTAGEFQKQLAAALWLVPVGLGAALTAALAVWSAVIIADRPSNPHVEIEALGHWLSYAAVGLVLAAIAAAVARHIARHSVAGTRDGVAGYSGVAGYGAGYGDAATWLMAALVPLVAATLNRWDGAGQWISYHALQAGWLAVATIACGASCWRSRLGDSRLARLLPHHLSPTIIAVLVIALAIRGHHSDPAQPWWSLAMALGTCLITAALGLARRSQPYAFASTTLAVLAVMLLWTSRSAWLWSSLRAIFGGFYWVVGWEVLVLVLAAAAGFWLVWEITSQRRRGTSLDVRRSMPRVHAAVACGLVPLCFLIRLLHGLVVEWQSVPSFSYDTAAGIATAALGGLLGAALWDRRASWSLPMLYVWGLAAGFLAMAAARPWLPQPMPRLAALVLMVAAHVALSGQLWSWGANFSAWGARAGIPEPIAGLSRTAKWLPAINLLLAGIVCLASLTLVLTMNDTLDQRPFRVAAALGPAIAAWGLACLAQERRTASFQLTALLAAGFSAVLLGWSRLDGNAAGVWMERVFRLLMVLSALTFAYGLVLPRFLLTGGSWHAATRQAGYLAGAAAMLAFAATLALEVALYRPGLGAPVNPAQVIAIAVVLVGLIAGLLSMALLPGRDPLLLSENWKQAYVYAAEATGALLFAHLYLCQPQWFDTLLRPYWPFVVMALAFLGVGAAELFHRRNVRVLAQPLERTGALLPLLPVLGMWAMGSSVDYALLLFVVGILYLVLSATRKSWAAMIAAAVAGNGALWSLFHEQQFNFAGHPQLWLIPPALSVLAAAQVNRHRLPVEALTAIRYAATIVIYISSTSQIFIDGLGQTLLAPMVLLGLSVAGAFAGIALRVRAFLYLGASFTLLALISMVFRASRSIDHNWPLWAFGIFLGVGILVLLVLFEKNKTEMHQLAQRLRQWEQ
jgi:hypothetical protein